MSEYPCYQWSYLLVLLQRVTALCRKKKKSLMQQFLTPILVVFQTCGECESQNKSSFSPLCIGNGHKIHLMLCHINLSSFVSTAQFTFTLHLSLECMCLKYKCGGVYLSVSKWLRSRHSFAISACASVCVYVCLQFPEWQALSVLLCIRNKRTFK